MKVDPRGNITASYAKVNDNLVKFTSDYDPKAETSNASPESLAVLAKLRQAFVNAANTKQQTYDNSNNVGLTAVTLAADEEVLQQLIATQTFFRDTELLLRVVGFTALGGLLAGVSDQLNEAQGYPPARAAYVVAVLSAAITMGTAQAVDSQIESLGKEIEVVRKNIELREAYLFSQEDYGGATNPYRPPVCIYSTRCVDSYVCVRQDLVGGKDCTKTNQCFDELLSCRSND